MNTVVSRIEPLAFRFETGCIRHDRRKPRARGKAERTGNNNNHHHHHHHDTSNQHLNHNVKQPSRGQLSTGPGTAAVTVDVGGLREPETGGGEDQLVVRVHAARWLHMRAFLSPLPFCSPLNGRLQGTGSALMAPAQTEPVRTTASLDNPIPDLPAGTKVSYLAEGGANVVYRIVLPENVRPEVRTHFHGKLLRARKLIDSSVPYVETLRNFDIHIRQMFDVDELVDQQMVRLPKGFIAACNDQLRLDEAAMKRPKSRHNVYLSTKEPFGLLITDMTPEADSGVCLWEFKPKWLLQSPSAPPDANRCRTCALRDMKNHNARMAGAREVRSFCPFDLISDDFEDVLRATSFIKGAHSRARVAKFLHRNSTLSRLRSFHEKMNAVGLPGLGAPYQERALSMTLRDCTMYVKVPYDESSPIEARLGDLDFKTGLGGKVQYWRDTETRLIEEGWYSGVRDYQSSGECSLLRQQDIAPASSLSDGVAEEKSNGATIDKKQNGTSPQAKQRYPYLHRPVPQISNGDCQSPYQPKPRQPLSESVTLTNGAITKHDI